MDVEKLLVSAIVQERDLAPVAEAHVTSDMFLDSKARSVFNTILSHKSEYGVVPTLSALKADHPNYPFVKVDEPISFLIDRIRENHKGALLEIGMVQAAENYDDGDYDEVANVLARTLAEISLQIPNTKDIDLTETGLARLERYLSLKDMPDGLRGYPTGFPTIDRATQGLQNQQLVTFIGPPKAGKSTTLMLMAMAAHLAGARPLFIGFEMSNEEQEERFDAIKAGISHARLRNGTLKRSEWDLLEKSIRQTESMPSFYLSADITRTATLTGVATKVESLKPDIVIVDGVYMMNDEQGEKPGSPQALTNITRGFKKMAQSLDIPTVISTQTLSWKTDKRRGITEDSIGYSSSFAQDSDVILGVEKTDEPSIQRVKVVLARNAPPIETYVQWDWERGTFEELSGNPFDGGEEGWGEEGTAQF